MKDIKLFKPLVKLITEDKSKIIFAFFIVFINSIIGISYGYLCGRGIEAITYGKIDECVICFILYFLAEICTDGFLGNYSVLILNRVEVTLSKKIKNITFVKMLDLPAVAFEKISSGEIINRITNDTETLNSTFSEVIETIVALLGSIIVLVYIFYNSIIIGFEIIFFIIVMSIFIKIFNPKIKKKIEEVKNRNDEYVTKVTESVRGIREIKSLGIKNNIFSGTRKLVDDITNLRKNQFKIEYWYDSISDLLRGCLEVGSFITCAFLIVQGKSNLTFLISLTYYIYRYTWLIEKITSLSKNYQKLKVSVKRINELIYNELYEDEKFGSKIINVLDGKIEFKNVRFAYNDIEILKGLNLELIPNKKQAIIGKSGQGKSTLFNILTKMFYLKDGEVLIDGVNINEYSEYSLRKNVSIIRQDPFVFNLTIKENFEIVDPNIKLDDIRRYAKMAYIDDYIMSLPLGYDTLLGEGGINLSGGQKQRLAIARTLAKKSKIILFDEATSALDNESQQYIKKAIDELAKNHTVIIVAHRLSTIIDADIIHVIDNGVVTSSGTHSDLITKSSIYKELYKNGE